MHFQLLTRRQQLPARLFSQSQTRHRRRLRYLKQVRVYYNSSLPRKPCGRALCQAHAVFDFQAMHFRFSHCDFWHHVYSISTAAGDTDKLMLAHSTQHLDEHVLLLRNNVLITCAHHCEESVGCKIGQQNARSIKLKLQFMALIVV